MPELTVVALFLTCLIFYVVCNTSFFSSSSVFPDSPASLSISFRMLLSDIRSAMFREEYRQMVLVKDIELYSMCEHHMLPFYGKAHVAYIPNGYITGLSKIARVVDCFARRLQVQERMTVQIRDCIQEALAPMGVAVVIEASHTCMQMRGVQKQNSATTTSAFTGTFLSDHRTREEFMNLIGHRLR